MFLVYWQLSGSLSALLEQLYTANNTYGNMLSERQNRRDAYICVVVCLLSAAYVLKELLTVVEFALGYRKQLYLYDDVSNACSVPGLGLILFSRSA